MMIPAIAVLLMKGLQASWEIAWHTGRADRTVMGRGPSRSYQVTSHPAARATWRPTSPGMTPWSVKGWVRPPGSSEILLVEGVPGSWQAAPDGRHGTRCDKRRGQGPAPGSPHAERGRGRAGARTAPAEKSMTGAGDDPAGDTRAPRSSRSSAWSSNP